MKSSLSLFAFGLVAAGQLCAQPSGPIVPELVPLEQAMTNFMATHGFDAGTIALMKDSKVVLRQGYGWRDTNLTVVIHPDNIFRLASVSKTITDSAIRKLLNAGAISASTKVYSYLGIPPWGGVLGDSRITNITVQHLIDHSGGWNRDTSPVGDPVFSTIQISSQMGLSYPAAPTNVISWMFSKPLDFTPGTTNAYSNFGFDVLGRVIEKASGKSYINYVQQDLLGPFGITDIAQARSRPMDLDPWEIWYADSPTLYPSAVDYPTNISVRWADGGGYYESFDAFGGLTATAISLCRYMQNYWVAGDRRVPGTNYGWTYVFYGSLPGTTTVIHQIITQNSTSTNGLEFATLFNERTAATPGNDNDEAHTAIVNASASVVSWPTNGGGMIQWNVAVTNVDRTAGSVTVQLVRSGLSTLPVKVSYTTYSKTAGLGNYVPSSAIVSFAGGETAKNVTVTILNDGQVGPTKQFLLELISASGGAWFGSNLTCAVNITQTNQCPSPVLTCATNKTVQCAAAWSFDPPSVFDSCCGTNYTVTSTTVTNNACPPVLVRTWVVTNCLGQSASCTQAVTAIDTTAPSLACAANKVIACGSAWNFNPPTAFDLCCGTNVTINILNTLTNGTGCDQSISRVWQAVDCCTNLSATCTQTVTFVQFNAVIDKWLQIPDTTTNGLDVLATSTNILADDFRCNATGPITQIRIWGSWYNEAIFPAPCFCLGIWSDVPAGGTNVFSRPGALLCNYCFSPGQYTNFLYTNGVAERFYDPNLSGAAAFIGSDFSIWEYVFDIPTNQPCLQTNGTIYWLSVEADCFDPGQFLFGWKTCPTNFSDGAVSGHTALFNNPLGDWRRMIRPPIPSINPTNSRDLAFGIITTTNQCAPPTITCVPGKTVQCGTNWTADFPAVFDSCCGTNYTLTLSVSTNNNCPKIVTFNWFLTDCAGYSASCTQAVTLVDTTPPSLTCGSNKIVQCGAAWSFDAPTPYDLCCGTNLTLTVNTFTNGTPCAGMTITRVWQATDCCSNSANCSQTVTVPGVAGTFLICASNKTVQCGTAWTFDPPITNSCCGTNVSVTVNTFSNGTLCGGGMTFTRTWQGYDCCSNFASCSQTVTIPGATGPLLVCASNKTVQCNAPWSFDPPTTNSCCGTNVTVTVVNTTTNGNLCSGGMTITRIWQATDCCSNSANCSQTVTVMGITNSFLMCASNKTVQCGTAWTFDAPTTNSCCGTNVSVSVNTFSNGTPCGGGMTFTRTWQGYDCCSNFAFCSQTVTIPGATGPLLVCASNKTVQCSAAWSFDPPATNSCCGTNVTVTVVNTTTNGNLCSGGMTITRIWQATDCCSNSANCSQTVTVMGITNSFLMCASNKTVQCGTAWTFDAPTTNSCCGTNVSVSVNTFSNGTPCGGGMTFTRTWQGYDCCSNFAFCSQTVTIPGATGPLLVCASNKTVQCSAAWSFDPPATNSCCGTNVTVTVVNTTTNGNLCSGGMTITRIWQATDCCSNSANCSQTVTVMGITNSFLTCSSNKTVQCGTAWTFDAPTTNSCCGTNVSVTVNTFSNGTPCGGGLTFTRTWQGYDCCSNFAFCSQTVTITGTGTLVLTCASNKTAQCGTPWSFDLPAATNTCCGTNVTVVPMSTSTNGVCPQFITRVWQAMDCCNNSLTCTQTVTVTDTNPPSITCPSNILVLTCSTNISVTWSITATDACSSVTVTSTPPSGSLFNRDTTNTVTAIATDACGNTNGCTFTVTIRRPSLAIAIIGGTNAVRVTWPDGGILQETTNLLGPWTSLPLATSPYTNSPALLYKFYRVCCP